MAQPQRDLTYPCRRIVMEHMRANHRYLLAACCPALRTIHAQVPLKINELVLATNGFIVDLVEHSLHTFVSNEAQLPRCWRVDVPDEGLTHDIDRFGLRHEDDAIEGDIVIQQWLVDYHALLPPIPRDEWTPAPSDWNRTEMRRERRYWERARVRRARRRARLHTYLQYTRYAPIQYPKGAWRRPQVKPFLQYALQTQVRYPRGIQLAEALRQLVRNFFAASEIYVNVLEIAFPFGILRLPRDLRFHVVSLKLGVCSAQVYNAISPIIIGDPLQKLAVTVWQDEDPIFDHEILRTINTLTIRFDELGIHLLERIEVPIVEVVDYVVTYPEELEVVGHDWIIRPQPLGRKMLLRLGEIGDLWDNVRELLRAERGTCPSVNMPREYPHCGFRELDVDTDFVIYVTKEEHPDEATFWYLIFEVMNVGRVIALEEEED